jgi:hypothetical protein
MNNLYICLIFTHILVGILIFKGLTARRLNKSFGVKGLRRPYAGRVVSLLSRRDFMVLLLRLCCLRETE